MPSRPAPLDAPARRQILWLAAAGAVLVPLGCDIPTDTPRLETRWVVPAAVTSFGVDDLLPGDVSVAPDASAFVVTFDPASAVRTLSQLCAACIAADGLTVPKPPFVASVDVEVDLPAEVFAISITGGGVLLGITNNLGFDPIRPGAGTFGSMTLTVVDDADGDVLSQSVVDGADQAFPSGSTLSVPLVPNPTEVNGSLVATVAIDSPLGDPVTVDADAELLIEVEPTGILVSSASIDVSSESVTFEAVDLDLENIDAELADRVIAGAFILDVTNPFTVGVDFDLLIDGPTIAPIARSASITADATSTVRIDFTAEEIRSLLGEPSVVLSGSADVDPAAGVVTVAPGQELVLEARFDLTVEVGGSS